MEVLHVPGVTPGRLALWEKATGSLFTGDTVYDDPLKRKSTPLDAAARESLERLRRLPVSHVYGGHFGRFGRARMLELIDGYLSG